MRILHADTDDLANPLRGGQPIRTYEINSRLSRHHDITVLTATYAGCERRVRRGSIEYRRLGLTIPGLGLSPHLRRYKLPFEKIMRAASGPPRRK